MSHERAEQIAAIRKAVENHCVHPVVEGVDRCRCDDIMDEIERSLSALPPAQEPEPTGRITNRCPACGHASLFVGNSGGLVCGWLECRDPLAIDRVAPSEALEWRPASLPSPSPALSPTDAVTCWRCHKPDHIEWVKGCGAFICRACESEIPIKALALQPGVIARPDPALSRVRDVVESLRAKEIARLRSTGVDVDYSASARHANAYIKALEDVIAAALEGAATPTKEG